MIDLNNEFNNWFNGLELYSLKSERFNDDLQNIDFKTMTDWLKAAYTAGAECIADDAISFCKKVDTYSQYVCVTYHLENRYLLINK